DGCRRRSECHHHRHAYQHRAHVARHPHPPPSLVALIRRYRRGHRGDIRGTTSQPAPLGPRRTRERPYCSDCVETVHGRYEDDVRGRETAPHHPFRGEDMTQEEIGLQLRSTVKKEGILELSLARVPIAEPKSDEVVVR